MDNARETVSSHNSELESNCEDNEGQKGVDSLSDFYYLSSDCGLDDWTSSSMSALSVDEDSDEPLLDALADILVDVIDNQETSSSPFIDTAHAGSRFNRPPFIDTAHAGSRFNRPPFIPSLLSSVESGSNSSNETDVHPISGYIGGDVDLWRRCSDVEPNHLHRNCQTGIDHAYICSWNDTVHNISLEGLERDISVADTRVGSVARNRM